MKLRLKPILLFCSLTLVAISVTLGVWLFKLNTYIDQQLLKKQLLAPLSFYSTPLYFFKGQKISLQEIKNDFTRLKYRLRTQEQKILDGDFALWSASFCANYLQQTYAEGTETCVAFKNPQTRLLKIISLGPEDIVYQVYENNIPQKKVETQPLVFAQYYGDKAILRNPVVLGDVPPLCLNAVLAIEDAKFLEPGGISILSIGRAFLKNLKAGRVVQGGSTITQQLVKNYFLTHERTFDRKFKEIFMSILLESKTSKDDILEAYINEIYMGQNGPFQVRGFAAAADFYFAKELENLELHECALLASIVNSPGLYNPFQKPENALNRREKVLNRMLELDIITANEAQTAKAKSLPQKPKRLLSEPAPFFVDATLKQLQKLGLDTTLGFDIETTLDLKAQESAQNALQQGLDNLESYYKSLKQNKESGKSLEGLIVAANTQRGTIEALVGGKNFRYSQFNRAIQSKRQIGSIMKPLVFLSALNNLDPTGLPYNPLTMLIDKPFNHKYDGQTWSPHNYNDKYYGMIPLYFALTHSLNSATAKVGIDTGLDQLVELAELLGIESELQPFPSLTLGAFETTALEVLQVYTTFSRLGNYKELTLIHRIRSSSGELVYEYQPVGEQLISKEKTSVLVGIMKEVLESGTAQFARRLGFYHPAAGKTGTTNDKKDAWFAGFTPYQAAVVWVGYDDNTPHGLTGAQGALPIWTQFMKDHSASYPPRDFEWPDTVHPEVLSVQKQRDLGLSENSEEHLREVELIFEN